jgi:hypothetical protein
MSDALCRPAVLSRELHPLAFAPSARASCEAKRLVSRRARARSHAAWLGQQGPLTQDAFSRREAQPCGRAKPSHVHLTFTCAWLAHPFARRGQTHRRQDGDCLDGLPCLLLGMPCGAPEGSGEDVSCQLLQPIYDTSTHRPFDSRANDFRRADRTSHRHVFGATARRSASLRRQSPRWARA